MNSPTVAVTIRPYPSNGLENVILIPRESVSVAALVGIALVAIIVGSLIVWLVLRRRRRVSVGRSTTTVGYRPPSPAKLG